jgi:hypothetical protein
MKTVIPALLACFITAFSVAQDVRLSDSVIFINDIPVALYSKELSKSMPRYNMEVYSFDDYVLIKAEIIKFNAPVAELRPFYYYELSFPPTADTFAIYIEEEAFPLVLAKIIRDYDLINKNELNKKNVSRFISHYYGGPALTAKIKSFEDHLNETRYFNEQEKRDRTKPVTIINDRVIMQDGVKIGLIAVNKNYKESRVPVSVTRDTSNFRRPAVVQYDYVTTSSNQTDILFANGRKVENRRYYNNWSSERPKKKSENLKAATEKTLYQISKAANKKIDSHTDQLLMWVCALIEDYAL